MNPPPENDAARTAAQGGLAITFAKAYFILTGLLQQVLLPRVLGMGGYGALSSALSIASISYNPITTTSIQGTSRALSHAEPSTRPVVLRRVLELHLVLAVVSGAAFFLLAPLVAGAIGAPHLASTLKILSLVLFLYSLYTPLIGALNAEKRFFHQAAFDVVSATLRTLGLVGGAYWFGKTMDRSVEGAAIGFTSSSLLVLVAALVVVGIGKSLNSAFARGAHASFLLRLLFGQLLFNLLLQSDLTLLRFFASNAAVASGAAPESADALVGVYRAIQLFGFLPFQLLVALTFVIFPMLARADADADVHKIREYVQTGMRITILVVGLLVSVISGLSGLLLRFVFPSPAAELGTRALHLLSIGLGCFAVFAVLVSILNSLRRERTSLAITFLAVVLVVVSSTLLARGEGLGEGLILRVAGGTSLGLFAALLGALWAVHRVVGRVVSALTLARVVGIATASILVARQLPDLGKLGTLVYAAGVSLAYVVGLLATRELRGTDFLLLKSAFSKTRAR